MSEEEALAALLGNEQTEPTASPPEEVEAGEPRQDNHVDSGAAEEAGDMEVRGEHESEESSGEGETEEPDVQIPQESGQASRGTGLMTMEDIRRMEVHNEWIKTLVPRVPKGVFIDDSGALQITVEAADDDLGQMALMFSEADLRAGKMEMNCKLYIARTVHELAGRNDSTISQVIDELGLCENTGRNYDTVHSWCKAFGELPDECFHPNLTMSHLVRAARIGKPKGAENVRKFNELRVKLLNDASIDPDGVSSRQIERELKQFKASLNDEETGEKKRESISVIHDRLLDSYRVLRVSEIDPEILENNGVSRADVVNQIEVDENELIERHKIIEDASQIVLHYTDAPTVDVEAEEE